METYNDLYCVGEFKKLAKKVNKEALLEHKHLKPNDLFTTTKRNTIQYDILIVLDHNVRSFSKQVNDIVSNYRIINNDIIGLTEKQINVLGSTYKIIKALNFFLSSAYGCRNHFAV